MNITIARPRRGLRALLAGVIALTAGIGAAMTVPMAASAAELDAITGVEISSRYSPIVIGTTLDVTATWAAPDGSQAGDTFSLSFPSPVLAYASQFELKDETGAVVGSCDVGPNSFLCTLNDYVETHHGVHGSLWFHAKAAETTESGDVDFTTGNDVQISVPIPGGGIGVGEAEPLPTSVEKTGWFESDGETITWRVYVPASVLTPVDGGDVVFTDIYDAGLQLDASSFRAHWSPTSAWPTFEYNRLSEGTAANTYSFVDSPATNSFRVTFNAPVTDGSRLYQFSYSTKIPAGTVDGHRFGNKVQVSGTDASSFRVRYVAAGGDGGGSLNTGGFSVTKTLSGSGAEIVPTDTTYAVDYSYDLAGTPVKGTLKIGAGETDGLTDLPTGTVVALAEVAPIDPAGLEYGTPMFSGEGVTITDTGATITIGKGTTIAIGLENPVTQLVPPPPPATPEPSETPESPVGPAEPDAPAPSAPDSPSASGSLAITGSDLGAGGAILGGILLLVGAAALMIRKRRSTAA
ncbi:Ig-like domain-containing protein [Microbacterium sp. NPDC090218]